MKPKLLEIKLFGGLCNKLFMLFSACDLAIKYKIKILEPFFGSKKKILFSDIYDINLFNQKMKEFNHQEDIIVPYLQKNQYTIVRNNINLWSYSEKTLKQQRQNNKMDTHCCNIIVLQSLTLNKTNNDIVNSILDRGDIRDIRDRNALHIRIEDDWIRHSNLKKGLKDNELYLINLETLIQLYQKKCSSEKVFFTTGQNHHKIVSTFTKNHIDSQFLFDNKLNYDINAAINFELCCRAKMFIGLSRSTFSNLITLKRYLLNKNNSFIYNLNNQISLRIDKGLHPDPEKSIKNSVSLT